MTEVSHGFPHPLQHESTSIPVQSVVNIDTLTIVKQPRKGKGISDLGTITSFALLQTAPFESQFLLEYSLRLFVVSRIRPSDFYFFVFRNSFFFMEQGRVPGAQPSTWRTRSHSESVAQLYSCTTRRATVGALYPASTRGLGHGSYFIHP
jgi:hypothetical protein